MKFGPLSSILLASTLLLAGCGGGGTGSGSAPPPPPPQPTPLTINTNTPGGKVGVTYSAQLGASGGTPPYTWIKPIGVLPDGFTMSSSGLITGTATSSFCNSSIQVSATDSSNPPQTAKGTVQLRIGDIGFIGGSALVGSTKFLGIASVDCGTLPITWSIASGSLPPGVQLSPDSTNVFSVDLVGNFTQAGKFNVTLQAQDASNQYQASGTFTVNPALITLTDGLMQIATVGKPFDHTVTVTGGTPPYNFSLSSGTLPPGLQLNAATGEITGTPQTSGLSQFTVRLTDSTNTSSYTVNKPDSILVTPAPLPARNDTIASATPIVPGTYYASLSPYTDTSGNAAPDQDFYSITGINAGETYQIGVSPNFLAWNKAYSNTSNNSSAVDPAFEIVDGNGNRLSACNDPVAENPPQGAPYTASPNNFTDPCVSHPKLGTFYSSPFTLRTLNSNQTFYIHVFDFQGRARPDFNYSLTVTKQ